YNNTFSSTLPNQITIASTGRVEGRDQWHNAIVSMYGRTHVTNDGYILGAIKLGSSSSDPNLGVFTNNGTWVAGVNNVFSDNSLHNYGVIEIVQPTQIIGSLKHYAGGEILFHLDPGVHFDQAALTVSGLARLEGKITPVLDNLLPGEFRLLKAGTLESTASIDDPFLFDWAQRITTDGELRLSALADFRPAGSPLSGNQEQAAQYLERAWEAADPYLAGHFAYMLQMDSAAQHGGMLDAIGGAELLHQQGATLQSIPTLLGEAIDCPMMGGAEVIVGEDSCAWMGVGRSWGRYTGKDTRRNDTDADLFSLGVQKEFRPGWFLSGVISRVSSDDGAATARSSGRSTIGSLGLKHQRGNWILGASLAWGEGSYDSVRSFALPLAGGASSAPAASLRSDSEMDIRALRARLSYEFDLEGWYLRPTLDVDALQTETSGFDEESGEHLFRLSGDGDSKRQVVATPHVEIGSLFDLGGENRLRAYVDAGVRLAPDADREMDVRISGANTAIGYLRNRMDVPVATGLLKIGAQIYRDDALDLRLEYGLEANDDFRNETATARVAWHF
ncbi:MAG: autotransporter domain-containing protein, partial [Gammaproteobacteria bacterium]